MHVSYYVLVKEACLSAEAAILLCLTGHLKKNVQLFCCMDMLLCIFLEYFIIRSRSW